MSHTKKLLLAVLLFGLSTMGFGSFPASRITQDAARNTEPESILVVPFEYEAGNSSSVYFVWYADDWPPGIIHELNQGSTLNEGQIYTPMVADGTIFRVNLNIPENAIIHYFFWHTKNREGQYEDYWDLQSGGKFVAVNELPIKKTAFYTQRSTKRTDRILSIGWLMLLLLLVAMVGTRRPWKKFLHGSAPPAYPVRALFTGISLFLFYGLARSAIIGIPLRDFVRDPMTVPLILKASSSDTIFLILFTMAFVIALKFARNQKVRKFLYGLFITLSLVLVLFAFVNISMVEFLGRPLNYQWLYYSDFLGSTDARAALGDQLSTALVINYVSLAFSMLLLGTLLSRCYFLLVRRSRRSRHIIWGLAASVPLLGIGLAWGKGKWPEGQTENAVVSLVGSWIGANDHPSFFTMPLHEKDAHGISEKIRPREVPLAEVDPGLIKNVIFLVMESAGAAYFDDYGGTFNISPNLSNYGHQALICENVYAHVPGTNRTLVSLLASIYPNLSYKSITQEYPNLEQATLSSVLKDNGFRTSFFSSADLSFQNSSGFLVKRGFDLVEDFKDIPCQYQFRLSGSTYQEGNGIDDGCLSDRMTAWIDEAPNDRFFTVLWTVQGHYPYYFEQREADFKVSDISFNRYLNALKHNDELLGNIMQALESRHLADSTLVVVTGDHGEAFGQHKQHGHGTGIYEENLRVPLYFINPVLFNNLRSTDLIGMKDIPSTTLSVLGIDLPPTWQGRNILTSQTNKIFFFAPWSDYLFGTRQDNRKFIFNATTNAVELYDLTSDPGELKNLATPSNSEETESAKQRVAEWVQRHEAFMSNLIKANQ